MAGGLAKVLAQAAKALATNPKMMTNPAVSGVFAPRQASGLAVRTGAGLQNAATKLTTGKTGLVTAGAATPIGTSWLAGSGALGRSSNPSIPATAYGMSNTLNNFNALPQMQTGGEQGATSTTAEDILARYYEAQNNPELSYLTGGPNLALIRDLQQQSAAKLKQYETNRADAENMYGQLTGKIEKLGTQIGEGYTSAIDASGTRANEAQTRMSDQLALQEQRRAAAAAELGVAPENVTTDYQSRGRVNDAMTALAGQSDSWRNLLSTMQQQAAERNANMGAAAKYSGTQAVLGLKQQYDAIADAIAQQIAAEQSKTPTRKLNELGKMLTKGYLKQLEDLTFGGGQGEYSKNPLIKSDQQALEYLRANKAVTGNPDTYSGPSGRGPEAFKTDMYNQIQSYFAEGNANRGKALPRRLQAVMEAYGWKGSDIAPYQFMEYLGGVQAGVNPNG